MRPAPGVRALRQQQPAAPRPRGRAPVGEEAARADVGQQQGVVVGSTRPQEGEGRHDGGAEEDRAEGAEGDRHAAGGDAEGAVAGQGAEGRQGAWKG